MWCIPEKPSAEFVFHREDVLEVYHRPYDPKRPVVCVDETFKQLIGETRQPLPPRPGSVERVDHVYTRNGVASLFLACEPLAGWRHIAVSAHRRRTDWAGFIRSLLEGHYPFWRGTIPSGGALSLLEGHYPFWRGTIAKPSGWC
jgi:hypothetical protein